MLTQSAEDSIGILGCSITDGGQITLADVCRAVANNTLKDGFIHRYAKLLHQIFYCPYDIHELVTDADMFIILWELNEDHKFLLFLSALRQYSSVKIAAIRGQTDRNIRKVRNTMLKKIRKKLLAALTKKVQAQQPLTLLEKEFLIENGVDVEKDARK